MSHGPPIATLWPSTASSETERDSGAVRGGAEAAWRPATSAAAAPRHAARWRRSSRDGPARGYDGGAEATRLTCGVPALAHAPPDVGGGELGGGGLGGGEKACRLTRNTARRSLAASDGGPPLGRGGGAVVARSPRGVLTPTRVTTADASDGGHGGDDMARSRGAQTDQERGASVAGRD